MPAPKSPQEMFQVMKANIEEKTGRSFDAWVRIALESRIDTFKALTDHMKTEHGVTHGYAQLIARGVIDPARLEAGNQDQRMVDELYSGKKAGLRPIYDRLISAGTALGESVETLICKTYTSLRSKSQFAIIAPRNNSSVDLELALPPDTPARGRLDPFRSSYPKFTHRIRITDPGQVDDEVIEALSEAHRFNLS
jgi:hypothetical protein